MGRSDLATQDVETVIATSRPTPMHYLHLAQARIMG